MVPIFNYKPIEKLEKFEQMLVNEFEKISHYELLYYSEISKNLEGLFDGKDAASRTSIFQLAIN